MTPEQQKGWAEFGVRMQAITANGNSNSTFIFMRVDTLPDGGYSTQGIHYQVGVLERVALVAHQLEQLQKDINANAIHDEFKHRISRVNNLFKKLFSANADVVNGRIN